MNASAKAIAWVERMSWVLIYGGMFTAVIGLATRGQDAVTGWSLIILGACVTVAGAFFIWLRSRMQETP